MEPTQIIGLPHDIGCIVIALIAAFIIAIIISLAVRYIKTLKTLKEKNTEVCIFNNILDLSQEDLKIIISPGMIYIADPSDSTVMKGYTAFTDIGRQDYAVNNFKLDRENSTSIINFMRENIMANAEQIGDDIRLELLSKHKNITMKLYDIDNETACKLFGERIVMSAFFDYQLRAYSEVVNINIIDNIVTNANQSSTSSSPFWFLHKNIIKHIEDISPLESEFAHLFPISSIDILTSFKVINSNKVTCNVTLNTRLGEDTIIPFSVTFNILSKDNTPFTGVTYEDIKIELKVPQEMKAHVTTQQPIKRTRSNKDNVILTDKKTAADGDIVLTYSFPNMNIPSLMTEQNIKSILFCHVDNCQIEAQASQKKQL